MKQWEYKIESGNNSFEGQKILNESGENGWELVAVIPYGKNPETVCYYFKKEKKDERTVL